MRQILVIAIALALVSTSAAASARAVAAVPDAVSASAPQVTSQLPRTAKPTHYAVEITPHADKLTFDGKVAIDIVVLQTTDRIVLQAANLSFARSTLAQRKGARHRSPRSAPMSRRRPPPSRSTSRWRRATTCCPSITAV